MYDHVIGFIPFTHFIQFLYRLKKEAKKEQERLSVLNKVIVKGFVMGHGDRSVGKVTCHQG